MRVQYLSSSLKRKYLFFFLLGGKESPKISLNIQVSPPPAPRCREDMHWGNTGSLLAESTFSMLD